MEHLALKISYEALDAFGVVVLANYLQTCEFNALCAVKSGRVKLGW